MPKFRVEYSYDSPQYAEMVVEAANLDAVEEIALAKLDHLSFPFIEVIEEIEVAA